MTELQCKATQMHMRWKQKQATKEEYRSIDQVCRDSARKAKAQLQLTLVMDINGNKNSF